MHWTYYVILFAILLGGWLLNIVTLPGLWVMVAAYGIYAWVTGWNAYVGWPSVITMLLLAAVAEVVEFVAGAAGSKAAGGRRRGMIGAIVGGIVGAIFFTGLVPVPILGTIIGVCVGTFLGAAIAELSDRGVSHSFRVGVGAAKGRLFGIVSKLGFGFIMIVTAMVAGCPTGAARPGAGAVGRRGSEDLNSPLPATTRSSETTQPAATRSLPPIDAR